MEFHDVLHGLIRLGLPFNRPLFEELLTSPEVTRLRNMRLMNFDVPLIQELASAKRLPHSIGVCYLAQEVAKRFLSSEEDASVLMVAALLHDAAIPPYGHLVESMLKKRHPEFDHSRVLGELLFGTYHEANIYHQIVPGRSLELHNILDKYHIDPERVIALVQPDNGIGTAISAKIDLDNIDNVHRMACLMGWKQAQGNLRRIVSNVRINRDLGLEFMPDALSALKFWQDLRQRLYTLIIAHPDAVAQNAFQGELVKQSIEFDVITPENWYINEPVYEELLRQNNATQSLADQLLSGSQFRLVDYVWFTSVGDPPCTNWRNVFEEIEPDLPQLSARETYFSWVETDLICRKADVLLTTGEVKSLGVSSSSCLIARVHTDTNSPRAPELPKHQQLAWRSSICEVFENRVSTWQGQVSYPEDYTGSYFKVSGNIKQFEFC